MGGNHGVKPALLHIPPQFLGIEGVGGIDRGGEAGTVVQIADPISCMVDLCYSPHHWGCADCGVYRPRHVNTLSALP